VFEMTKGYQKRIHERKSTFILLAASNSLKPGSTSPSSISKAAISEEGLGLCSFVPRNFSGASVTGGEEDLEAAFERSPAGGLEDLKGKEDEKERGAGYGSLIPCLSGSWIGVIPNARRTECARW